MHPFCGSEIGSLIIRIQVSLGYQNEETGAASSFDQPSLQQTLLHRRIDDLLDVLQAKRPFLPRCKQEARLDDVLDLAAVDVQSRELAVVLVDEGMAGEPLRTAHEVFPDDCPGFGRQTRVSERKIYARLEGWINCVGAIAS
jgi:hypothetical protein